MSEACNASQNDEFEEFEEPDPLQQHASTIKCVSRCSKQELGLVGQQVQRPLTPAVGRRPLDLQDVHPVRC
eukprot:1115826-Prorocentrum_lima.AAC.1